MGQYIRDASGEHEEPGSSAAAYRWVHGDFREAEGLSRGLHVLGSPPNEQSRGQVRRYSTLGATPSSGTDYSISLCRRLCRPLQVEFPACSASVKRALSRPGCLLRPAVHRLRAGGGTKF